MQLADLAQPQAHVASLQLMRIILLHRPPNTSSRGLVCLAIFRTSLYHLWNWDQLLTLGRVVAAVLPLILRLTSTASSCFPLRSALFTS